MYYVILVKARSESHPIDTTKWRKKWPADPPIKPGVLGKKTKDIDKLIEETIRAGDAFAKVKLRSLRFTDKNKRGQVEEGPEEGGGTSEMSTTAAAEGGEGGDGGSE